MAYFLTCNSLLVNKDNLSILKIDLKVISQSQFVMVHGKDALVKMTNTRNIWRKMTINFVRYMMEEFSLTLLKFINNN